MIHTQRELDGTDSVFIEIKDWLSPEKQLKIYDELQSIDDWKEGDLMGKPIKRLQKWYHDDLKYFSSFWRDQDLPRWKAHRHDDWLRIVRQSVQDELNRIFETTIVEHDIRGCNLPNINSTLINYYRDGSDSIKFHRDDERIFGDNPTVAMLIFGAERPLEFVRSNYDPMNSYDISHNLSEAHLNKSFTVSQGTLFIMMGSVQKYYIHGIQKDMDVMDERFSITFREHKN